MKSLDLLEQYITSWISKDKSLFLSLLDEDVSIVECCGASYFGKAEAERWFDDWNENGDVLSWNIQDSYYDSFKRSMFATWEFRFQHTENNSLDPCFNGITILKTKGNKIISLNEYSRERDLYRPYIEYKISRIC